MTGMQHNPAVQSKVIGNDILFELNYNFTLGLKAERRVSTN